MKSFISNRGNIKLSKAFHILGLSFIVIVLIASGNMACKKASEETLVETSLTEDAIPFEGVVKTASGKYIHIPKVQGFDIVIQGELQSGDLSTLVDKEVKGEGMFSPERSSVLIADSLEVKNESGVWQSFFTRTEDLNDEEDD